MQPGQQITATLRLVRLLGKGGMGSVWVADHLGIGTQVAVKFIAKQLLEDGPYVQRFRREAMAAAQIKSPHVAQVFDHGVTADGTPYIAMELLEGELLGKRLKRLGQLGLRETAMIVTQVAKALTRAHQLGIVHRDIKPDNIFLTDVDGEVIVKVIDFGVAKQSDEDVGMTTTGSMVGTPLYMSPEQLFSAKHVDPRSDLWSLAVVAYHAMTGRVPFSGDTLGSLSVAVHTGVYAPPSTRVQGIPPAVDAWFQRALQREPANRFQSARELAETLERAVMGAAWSAWTSTAMPLVSLTQGAALTGSAAPELGGSTPGVPANTGPGAISSSGAPIATGTYPSVAQGSVSLSTATRSGPTGRHMAAMVVAATIASITGGVGAVLLFRSTQPAGSAAATQPAVTATVMPAEAPAEAVSAAPSTTATTATTASAAQADASAAPTATAEPTAAPSATAQQQAALPVGRRP
ncbi:MAG TPA: protein kinase, partial [Candidatus Nanopelagicales bacterium]|nr:protein kinase [Candidatus Nanopelagicales bacterium]